MIKELEEYRAKLITLNTVGGDAVYAYNAIQALLRVIDIVRKAEGVMGYTSDHESGYAEGRESERQSIIDAILNKG